MYNPHLSPPLNSKRTRRLPGTKSGAINPRVTHPTKAQGQGERRREFALPKIAFLDAPCHINLYEYHLKLGARMALYVLPQIRTVVEFEGVQSLPRCQPDRVNLVEFKLIPTSYALRPLTFPDRNVFKRSKLLHNSRG